MTINPDIILGAAGVIFILIAIVVARLAYQYGCARRIDAGNRQLSDQDGQTGSSPAVAQASRLASPAVSSGEWAETEAVIINPLQGRITVNVIAQPDHE